MMDKEKEGWKSRFFVLRRTAENAWGFRTSWLFGKPPLIKKDKLAERETDVWELCRRYRFCWRDISGPEWLNALNLVGAEIPPKAMLELLALDVFASEELLHFSFPTAEEPYST